MIQSKLLAIPSHRPLTIFTPTSRTFPGNSHKACKISTPKFQAACPNDPIIEKSPWISAPTIFIPASKIFGKFSIIASTIFITISGAFSANLGSDFTIPSIKASKILMPTSITLLILFIIVSTISSIISGSISIKTGKASDIPWTKAKSVSIPVFTNSGKFCLAISTHFFIISGILAINCGKAWFIPFINEINIFMPTSINFGSALIIISTILGIRSDKESIMGGTISKIASKMFCNASINIGNDSYIKCGIVCIKFGTTVVKRPAANVPRPFTTFLTTGAKLFTKLPKLSTKLLIKGVKSAPVPTAVITFSHALLVALAEPVIVLAASLAVVPVTPISCCTTWIAL